MSPLSGAKLLQHVQRFAGDIGPRPAGHPAEAQARRQLEAELRRIGLKQIEQLSFPTADTWGYGTITPILLALIGNIVPGRDRLFRTLFSLVAVHQFWLTITARIGQQFLYRYYPQRAGGTLIARIPPKHKVKKKVVLIGHTDTNKHRLTFSPELKKSMRLASTSLLVTMGVNAVASFFDLTWLRRLTTAYLGFGAGTMLIDELGPYVEGANDNGSAMACVLGLGEQALANPLENTEVWLAFTGSEEVSHDGLNVLLDRYGHELADAYFIDFEMVGQGSIHYVQNHSGLIYFSQYRPDDDSLRLAQTVAEQRPDLQVSGRDVTIVEEVATLRRRSFKGLCLVGLAEDGFLANWHQQTDTVENIDPASLERAAKFAWAMIEQLDRQGE